MSTTLEEHNKAVLGRMMEVCNSHDSEALEAMFDELFAPDVQVNVPIPMEAAGAQVFKDVFGALYRAFPDLHIEVEDIIAEGEKVVIRNTVTGTHESDYMGVAPTGRTITWREIFICRFAGSRVVETWGIVDLMWQLSQLRQTGSTQPRP